MLRNCALALPLQNELTNSAREARVTRSGCLQTDQLWTAQYDTNPYATGKHLLLPYKCKVLPRALPHLDLPQRPSLSGSEPS